MRLVGHTAYALQRVGDMNAQMMEMQNRLVRLMREILQNWPDHGIMLIMSAERQVIQEDAQAIAGWAREKDKEKAG